MTLMRRSSPFSELVTLRQAMDRLFDDTVFRPFRQIRPVTPGEARAVKADEPNPAKADT